MCMLNSDMFVALPVRFLLLPVKLKKAYRIIFNCYIYQNIKGCRKIICMLNTRGTSGALLAIYRLNKNRFMVLYSIAICLLYILKT